MAYDFDETNPLDNAKVADFPTNERDHREAVHDAYEEEHDEGTGLHTIGQGSEADRDLAITSPGAAGNIWIRTDIAAIEYSTGSAWVTLQASMTGEVKMVSFDPTIPPEGWLECNGQAVLRASYPALDALYSAETYPWGNGNGTTTFNVPNMTGAYPVGFDSSAADADYDEIGETQGANTHQLIEAELAQHTHTIASSGAHNHTDSGNRVNVGASPTGYAGGISGIQSGELTVPTVGSGHTHTPANTGSNTPHENRPLSYVVGWIVKT